MTERPEAVVVGAGISGLTCLWRLRKAGLDAIGLESSDRVGGVIVSRRVDGFLVEVGPNTVAGSPELEELVAEAGLESEVVRAPERLPRFLYRTGELLPVPTGPIELAGTRILSAGAKWSLLRELWVSRPKQGREESVRDFITRRFGLELYEKAVAALLSGTFAGDGSKLAMRAVFPLLVELEEEHGSVLLGFLLRSVMRQGKARGGRGASLSFRDGFEMLPKRLADALAGSLRMKCEVLGITPRSGGREGSEVVVRGSQGEKRITTRAVVVAVPPEPAARLLEGLSPQANTALREFEAPPLACVSLAWARSHLAHAAHGFGFLAPRGEGLRILGCVWPSSIYPERAPQGQASFTSFVGGTLDPEAATLPDAELVEVIRKDLTRVLGASGPPRVLAVDRHRKAIPQYTLGHLERVARIRSAVAELPGLFLTGSFLTGISIGDCVREANDAARAVIESLRINPRHGQPIAPSHEGHPRVG